MVISEKTGRTALLTINRPGSRNALSKDLVSALKRALASAEADLVVRSVLLTGAGETFCAGADLKALGSMGSEGCEPNVQDAKNLMGLYLQLARCKKPVVAAVNGPALAGGCGLAALCDVVVCSGDARFGYPEVRVGFVAAMVMVFLQRTIGERAARRLLLTGEVIGPEEALRVGLADELVPAPDLLKAALERCERLASGAPSSQAWTKELLFRASGLSIEEALLVASNVNALARSEDDVREGISAFLEKRKASWTNG